MTSAKVRIEDNLLWATHIEGDNDLIALIVRMKPQTVVELEINGFRGAWQKTRQSPRQATGHALNPQGEARRQWESMRSEGIQSASIRCVSRPE